MGVGLELVVAVTLGLGRELVELLPLQPATKPTAAIPQTTIDSLINLGKMDPRVIGYRSVQTTACALFSVESRSLISVLPLSITSASGQPLLGKTYPVSSIFRQ